MFGSNFFSIIQTEQQMFMAFDIDSRSGLHDFTL